MSDLLVLNAVNMLADRMAFITVGIKAGQFIKLLRTQGATANQVQTWLIANPDQYRDIFDNYYVTQAILSDGVAAKLVYDSPKGAELAMNSYSWIAEFVKQGRNVDVILTSTAGMRALWASEFALNYIYNSRTSSAAWQRFYDLSSTYLGRWQSGFSQYPVWGAGLSNGQHSPYPNTVGNAIVLSFVVASASQVFSFNSRVAGGPEITNATSASEFLTFAAHANPSGTRVSGTSHTIVELKAFLIP